MNMKLWKSGLAAVVVTMMVSSCDWLDNDKNVYYPQYPNAVVTVKTTPENTVYYQLDDSTTLIPTNITKNPYKGECRALVNVKILDEEAPAPYDKSVYVNWIDSILTKPAVLSAEDNDKAYGSDEIDILSDWVNVAEDGYLTLHVVGNFGASGKVHTINLLTGVNPEDPYEVELRHDAKGDIGGHLYGAYVAFRLSGLPDSEGKTVNLTLKWKSPMGERSQVFKYKTRKD